MKLLRRIVILAMLVGIGYAAFAVPIGGRTLWERAYGIWSGTSHNSDRRTSQTESGEDTDQLTAQDRKSMNTLIEEKLREKPHESPATSNRKK